jgi:Na+-transporting methylmalonyl-CoA/oxaloacetate decarboxylase gamma subunit
MDGLSSAAPTRAGGHSLKRWIVLGGIGIVLVVLGVLAFVMTRTGGLKGTVANNTAETKASAQTYKEVKVGSDIYKILSVESDRYSSDKLSVRFKIRMTHNEPYGTNLYENSFRLIVDGAPLAPKEAPNEVVAPYSAKDVAVVFIIPKDSTSVELQVGRVDGETDKIPIDLKAASGAAKDTNRSPASSNAAARKYPAALGYGDEVRAGEDLYKILSAALDRYSSDSLSVQIKVRMTHDGPYSVNLYENSFRLLADGVPLAPTKAPNEVVESGSSKDVEVTFVIPEATSTLELQVGQVGKETSKLPIAMDRKD